MSSPEKTVAIIGGGPVGLAAAAHALGRGLKPVVLEAGDKVGHAVRQWSHVRMFSPWSYNVDKAAEALLREEGWNSPEPDQYPTGGELVAHYLEPLATRTKLSQHIQTNARVISVGRVGFDKVKTAGRENAPFEIRYQNGKGPSTLRADAVIDASGTWDTPNPAGVNGLEAIGEAANAKRIAYGMPDVLGGQRARYANKVVAVLGAGHSAVGTILDLAQLKKDEPATRNHLGPARRHAGKVVRRRRQRQALCARRAWQGLRPTRSRRRRSRGNRLPPDAYHERRRQAADWVPDRLAAAVMSRPMS